MSSLSMWKETQLSYYLFDVSDTLVYFYLLLYLLALLKKWIPRVYLLQEKGHQKLPTKWRMVGEEKFKNKGILGIIGEILFVCSRNYM